MSDSFEESVPLGLERGNNHFNLGNLPVLLALDGHLLELTLLLYIFNQDLEYLRGSDLL